MEIMITGIQSLHVMSGVKRLQTNSTLYSIFEQPLIRSDFMTREQVQNVFWNSRPVGRCWSVELEEALVVFFLNLAPLELEGQLLARQVAFRRLETLPRPLADVESDVRARPVSVALPTQVHRISDADVKLSFYRRHRAICTNCARVDNVFVLFPLPRIREFATKLLLRRERLSAIRTLDLAAVAPLHRVLMFRPNLHAANVRCVVATSTPRDRHPNFEQLFLANRTDIVGVQRSSCSWCASSDSFWSCIARLFHRLGLLFCMNTSKQLVEFAWHESSLPDQRVCFRHSEALEQNPANVFADCSLALEGDTTAAVNRAQSYFINSLKANSLFAENAVKRTFALEPPFPSACCSRTEEPSFSVKDVGP